ncbi:MAG TPA: anti-sigma factor [Acidimicrobiales bacterium]|nr:anti-sigma factor [Acidimicrobiales bacterium]
MNHDEAYELLELAALDAIDATTAQALEVHVSRCAQCQSELDEYRRVATHLGNAVEPLPETLWSTIASRLHERPKTLQSSMPTLVSADPPDLSSRDAPVISMNAGRPAWAKRARSIMAAASVAAAAAIIVLSLSLANANSHVAHLRSQLSNAGQVAIASAFETPGHYEVKLTSPMSRNVAQFVMLPSGQGYLLKSSLPRLASAKTYQLWGIVKGQPVSLGVMGRDPHQVSFTMAGPVQPSVLAVTVEPVGGSPTPSTSPVVVGKV